MLPLSGIRILDLSRTLIGPFATQFLADFGAEVIRVEDINGEITRVPRPPLLGDKNHPRFYAVNRHKKSMSLDLRQTEGREIFKKMIPDCDILVENFRPGTMQKLGLDYARLKDINPQLIYCALTAYGSTGPLCQSAGHDLNILSLTGITELTGIKNNKPGMAPVQISSACASLYGITAILLALRHREKTGCGQFCDIAMFDGAISILAYALAEWSAEAVLPERGGGSTSGGFASYQLYETKDEKYISLAASEFKSWEIFCQRLGHPEFIPEHRNIKVQPQLISAVENLIKQKNQAEWLELFADSNVCITPVLNFEEMCQSAQTIERQMVINMENFENSGKTLRLAGNPVKLSLSPAEPQIDFPALGQDTMEILAEIGYSQQEIQNLIDKQIVRAST
ncbi:MAG: CoA transferase [Syntrophomonadaceae bacterium]|jgi:crotonobetainyl-CoA:carnitine CoA-transferase CaiB-like acyl-CoA transferase|nr:CoA transferase [Syntrophomonadaceae bacterium]